jgi:pimeloyl-ACP methyl ester carboxylesterase
VAPGKTGDVVFWLHPYSLNSTCWVELWDALPEWQHVGLDIPGHGSSLPLERNAELPALARQVGEIAIARQARHLVGLSFGSLLVLQMVLEYPGAFTTVTLGAPMLGGGPFDRDIEARYAILKSIYAKTGYTPELHDRWMDSGSSLFRGIESHPHLAAELRRQLGRHPWWELADDTYQHLWRTPQTLKMLATIEVPTLLLVGSKDSPVVQNSADLLQHVVQNCQHCRLPDLGHLCLLEDPVRIPPIIQHHWRLHTTAADVTIQRTGQAYAAHD